MRRDGAHQPAAGPLRVVIAGGGTGGHLYPGIAVARELLARVPDAIVSFAGTAQGDRSARGAARGLRARRDSQRRAEGQVDRRIACAGLGLLPLGGRGRVAAALAAPARIS